MSVFAAWAAIATIYALCVLVGLMAFELERRDREARRIYRVKARRMRSTWQPVTR